MDQQLFKLCPNCVLCRFLHSNISNNGWKGLMLYNAFGIGTLNFIRTLFLMFEMTTDGPEECKCKSERLFSVDLKQSKIYFT